MDKKFGKNVDKVFDFLAFVEDYNAWYDWLTKRSDNVVGNGRVSGWLYDSDVEKICKERGYTPRQIVAINEEFDEDRLSGIWQHTCDSLSDQYVDWRGGCAYNDYYKKAQNYATWLRYNADDCVSCEVYYQEFKDRGGNIIRHYVKGLMKYYHEQFSKYKEEGHTFTSLWKKYQKEHAEEIKMLGYLQTLDLDTKDIWGGKYPVIADKDKVDLGNSEEVYDFVSSVNHSAKTNKEFFDHIKSNVWSYYHSFDSVKEIIEYIDNKTQEMREMREAVEFVEEYIDSEVKGFKDALVERLGDEIDEFLTNSFSVEERVREGLAKINHVELVDDTIVTDLNARVTINSAKEIIERHNNGENVVGEFVGAYKINQVFTIEDETYFKIGCHLLKLSETLQKLGV